MAEKTRRAYGVDLGQLAEWASAHDLDPGQLDHRAAPPLRRRAVRARRVEVHGRPQARRHPVLLPRAGGATARWRPAPPTWWPRPKRDSYLPDRAQAGRACRALLDAHARLHAARAARPRDLRAGLLGRAAGGGAGEPGPGEPGPRRRGAARGGQGRRARASCPPASPRGGPSRPTCDRGRPAAGRRGGGAALFLSKSGRRLSTSDVRRRLAAGGSPRGAAVPGCRRTPSGTRSPPTCWRAAPTCASSRSCWATPPSARPRPTLG